MRVCVCLTCGGKCIIVHQRATLVQEKWDQVLWRKKFNSSDYKWKHGTLAEEIFDARIHLEVQEEELALRQELGHSAAVSHMLDSLRAPLEEGVSAAPQRRHQQETQQLHCEAQPSHTITPACVE